MLTARRAFAPLVARSNFSTQVCAAASVAAAGAVQNPVPSSAEVGQGVKAKLYEVFSENPRPLSAAELWEIAEGKGVKSKRHMKLMLQDLRKRGWVITKPGAVASAKRDKSFRYELSKKTLESVRYKRDALGSAAS